MNDNVKQATVTSCEYDAPHAFQNGDVVHYHRLTLSNGDKGNCAVAEMYSSKISVGTEINYKLENGRIKLVSWSNQPMQTPRTPSVPPSNNSAPAQKKAYGKTPQDAITFILGYASNRHVAKITATKKDVPLQEMLDDADLIYAHYKKMLSDF